MKKRNWLLVLLSTVAAVPLAYAEEAASTAVTPVAGMVRATSTTGVGGQIVQLLLGLLLVIGLIFILAWLARRLQQQLPGGSRDDVIQLLATRPLGQRERLLLVQVGSEQVLLGLTPGSIKTLHVMQEPVATDSKKDTQSVGEFAKRLKQVLRQTDSQDKES